MRSHLETATVLLPLAAALAACAPQLALPGDAGMLVSTGWLAEHLDDPSLVVLHVARERAHYDAGHIPGARFLKYGEIVIQPEGVFNELPSVEQLDSALEAVGVSDDAHVVLYGDWGGLSAARAFMTFDYLGHGERTSMLDGGIEVWRLEGRSVSTDSPGFARGEFTPRLRESMTVDAEWVTKHIEDDGVSVLDARPPQQYSGESTVRGIRRPGHVPGAGNVYWKSLLVSDERPVMKSREALEEALLRNGTEKGDLVVTYCNTGVMASHLYFVARYVGYDAKLYDLSFIDWSNRTDYPVAP